MRKSELSPDRRQTLVAVEGHSGAWALVPPDAPSRVPVDGAQARDVGAAERALESLRERAERTPELEPAFAVLRRREAVRSRAIEGTRTTEDDLIDASIGQRPRTDPEDLAVTANYLAALDRAEAAIRGTGRSALTVELVQTLHAGLLAEVDSYRDAPGALRTVQVWVGGGGIHTARMVPPPPDRIRGCLESLFEGISAPSDEQSPFEVPLVTRAAVTHAQFEAIHPFRDGNGRVGRMLVPLVLLADGFPPVYVSGALHRRRSEYFDRLEGVQLRGAWPDWTAFLARALSAACEEANTLADAFAALRSDWADRLSDLRSDALAHRLPDLLVVQPRVTAPYLRTRFGASPSVVKRAIDQVVARGLLRPVGTARRNRVFEAPEALDVLAGYGTAD